MGWIIIGIFVLILVITIVRLTVVKKMEKSAKKIYIGRDSSCDIDVDECYEDVSHEHAVIFIEDNKLVFEDQSTNGSYVNDEKVHHKRQVLRRGDTIRLGETYIVPWSAINLYFPEGTFKLTTKRTK